ncbi:MAG TPA: maleylacetoacetate isomerase [Bdellovibrionota bacterium]|jgi:maleylpyruvate isomerase|nr:maleylacetoacetate isomerase [Bdellovibrionota bacterium]
MTRSAPPLKLYSYFRSSCSYRVRIALHYKGLHFETQAVHLVKDGGAQKREDYLRINPMAQVPALQIEDGRVLTQSTAILEYLEERWPKPALAPRDPWERAKAREIAQMINSGIQPIQNLSLNKELTARFHAGEDQIVQWNRFWIQKGLAAIERQLAHTAGTYCVGSQLSWADVCLVPQVYNARRFALDLSPFPCVARIDATCTALPAFAAAHPDKQPDSP